ncbi:MAG: UPF0182 family protein [Candidatus Poribacteria bacterium]|nr:UPF0182 family protein [Candidatus Poribacteria bacterium]
MTPDLAIAWLIFNVILVTITLVWGIFRFRRGIWYRKLSLKVQAYLLWGIGGIALISSMIPFSYLYIEHLWFFENVGYTNVFWKIIKIRWGLFFGFFFVALAFMNLNAVIAKRLCPEPREFSRWTHQRTVSFHRTFFIGTILLAILFAIPMMPLHDDFILYTGQPAEPELVPANKILTGWGHIKNMDQPIEPELVPANLKENQSPTPETLFFGKDTNFYLFSFPMHKAVSRWVQILLWVTCGIVGLLYNFYYRRDARSMGYVKRNIVFHGSILWLMLLAIAIWRGYVNLWSKVYTPSLSYRFSEFHGIFYADRMLAGATQVYCVILLFVGIVVLFNLFWRKRPLWYAAIGISIISYLCLLYLYPIGVNLWAVRTAGDAEDVELKYLSEHIRDTRIAFDLQTIKEKVYTKRLAQLDDILQNEDVMYNLQFWDRRVFYNILRNEEIKRHHDFHPYADVDRYRLTPKQPINIKPDGSQGNDLSDNLSQADQKTPTQTPRIIEQYRQVLIAAREIDPDPGPKEWGELKLKYTHGYGVCVAPVNEVQGDRPSLWLKGVPILQTVTGYHHFIDYDDKGIPVRKSVPISKKEGLDFSKELEVKQPRIYYGEMTDDYVIVKTDKSEYNIEEEEGNEIVNKTDLDEKENNEVNSEEQDNQEDTKRGYHYEGTGGVRLGGWFRRFCFAVRFSSVYILRNSLLDQNSRVMYWRKIGTRKNERMAVDRLSHIAPFLDFDPDPYIVIDDGQLWWIVDFYVTSKQFPNAQFYADDTAPIEDNDLELYTEPRFKRFKRFNYIRNSGVAVVNAYNGNVNFYTDIDDEPITEIYRKAFPKLFKDIDEMPEGLKAHRRFPDYLTRIQAKMFGDYHVEDSEKFFNKSNQWKISMEAYYSETPNHEMMPYYAMLKLPGEEKAEFVNMVPFTPPKKDNFMKGWLIARCDQPNYGERIVYTLQEQNVKGPKHVEDDISKNTELAKLFRDLRPNNDIIPGNLHVIPIDDGIFYFKPIFVKPKIKKGKNGPEETDTIDPIRDLPTLKTIVVKAADHELAADISFINALVRIFLGQPSNSSVEGENEEKEPTLSEQFEILVKAVEDFGKALKAAENGNGQNISAKAAGNTKTGSKN